MNLEYLIPASEAHAIQRVIFALEWQGELPDQTLEEVQKLAPNLKHEFPEMLPLPQKMIIFDMPHSGGLPPPRQEKETLGAVMFRRSNAFGNVVSEMIVARASCVISISEYARWDPALQAVMRSLKVLLPTILKQRSISIIALQYEDMFTWKDEPDNLVLSEVFKENSNYLAPNVFRQTGLWHSHHGYVIDKLGDLPGKCTDNINVGIVDTQGDRSIQIATTHQCKLDNPLRISNEYMQLIEKTENILHRHNKKVLSELLAEGVCLKINLKSETV